MIYGLPVIYSKNTMTLQQFQEKIEQKALEQDKHNADHPYRRTAQAIISQIIETRYGDLSVADYNILTDQLVALLDNYLSK
jgi:hypothetical protein